MKIPLYKGMCAMAWIRKKVRSTKIKIKYLVVTVEIIVWRNTRHSSIFYFSCVSFNWKNMQLCGKDYQKIEGNG